MKQRETFQPLLTRPAAHRLRGLAALGAACAAAMLLSACSSSPRKGERAAAPAEARTASAGKGGGYYLDDGPGEQPPPELAAIPDAQPRAEPLHRFANRPYTALGQRFVPATRLAPFRQSGVASWYGRRFHGRPTSSGEPYDMYAMTAAHPTLPIPSYVRVTHAGNGRSVVVRINDRGPFLRGRAIDLSYAAASKLGYINAGHAKVHIEQILPDEVPPVAAVRSVPPVGGRGPEPAAAPSAGDARAGSGAADEQGGVSGIFLQLGVFSSRDNAEGLRASVHRDATAFAERLELLADGGRYRLHAGPFASEEDARLAAVQLMAALKLKPLVVVR
ncbi:MAG: septal ring lytic transglycosylase RlpA family protein [Thauera phenolivorans]|uniref:Endolytic peptidoglycan transglycosylase RlpA n=1 Tax=Thauera phenolivorans TaxID=1792543 RepID=A0A7X7LTQ4_9RHOO|nr:septal ring lytic transglycosylase RlpA family protein [Thauera phenolivorans]NLF53222.1 septal ring lytic transglycosylase RlpA family protein [Thauera phenolivorans]